MPHPHFTYQAGQLHCEQIPLAQLAKEFGTPLYVYSQVNIMGQVKAYQQTLSMPQLACFAVKANGNPVILRLLAQAGLGADVTSGGELFLARHAGFAPDKIIYSGVGKTEREIREAITGGVKAIHIESAMEFAKVAEIAESLGQVVNVGVRVNPDVQADTHAHISTGRAIHKFGVTQDVAMILFHQARQNAWLQPVGIAAHIGSQILDLAPYAQAVGVLVDMSDELAGMGIRLEYIDVGGGLGIDYAGGGVVDPAGWISTVSQPIKEAGYGIVMEPGRSLVGSSGVLLTQVVYTKVQGGKKFVITDAGMNDLIRPTLYGAHHPIWPLKAQAKQEKVDVVGPICETGDFLAKERVMVVSRPGDILAVMQAGAYGFGMSSNYNGRTRPGEVLVNGDTYTLIRPRQQYEALLL